MENTTSEKRFALLIDADNVSSKYLKPILDELSKYGTVTYKRIYGDWTLNLHAKWKEALLKNSITPIQQFGYTQGKNATDSAMIIDAMDILYTNSVDGFCIVSSDSDFTRLAVRLRESGRMVIGMGEQKTPIPFRTACDVFTILELLAPSKPSRRGRKGKTEEAAPAPEATATRQEIEQAVVNIISDNTNNGKATGLGEIGSRLQKIYPDFDVRSYGTRQISKLLDGFASIVVTRNGYNVNVELAEGVEPGSILNFENDAEAAEDAPITETEASTDVTTEPAADSPEADPLGRKRRRRGSRGRKKSDAEAEANEQAEFVEEAIEAPTIKPSEPVLAEKATPEEALALESNQAESGDEEKETPKPKRTRRARSRKKDTEATSETTPEAISAEPQAEPEPKPVKPKRGRRKKAEESSNQSEAAKSEATQPSEAASEEAPADQPSIDIAKVNQFLIKKVQDAGTEGISATRLGRSARGKYRTFKVKDLGYPNLREYMATLDGITVEKRGNEYIILPK